jgi:hypothetical protein
MLRRTAALLGVILSSGLAWSVPVSAAHASIVRGPQLVCHVSNGTTGAGRCGSGTPQNPYTVTFTLTSVGSGSVTGWDPPTGSNFRLGVGPGRQAGDLQCVLTVYPTALAADAEISMTVHYRTDSIRVYQSSATATMPGRCPFKC